jgi:hypothetical protein
MSAETCLHNMLGRCVAVRRFYEGIPGDSDGRDYVIAAQVGVILWHLFAVSTTLIPGRSIPRKDFKFHINRSGEFWTKTPNA